MAASPSELEGQVQLLPADDRAQLAEMLLEPLLGTCFSDVQAAWKREIEARVAAYDRGDLRSFPAEDVFAEAKRTGR